MFLVRFILLNIKGLEATCQADSQNTAANYIQNNDGTALNTSAWAEGDTYTLTCKQDVIAMAWSNNIRVLDGVDLNKIDQYSATTRSQQGEVVVKCSGGKFVPDIFGYEVRTWCGMGCNKVPEDFKRYWSVEYPSTAITKSLTEAPVAIEIDYAVKIRCRDGYAQATADEGRADTYCTNSGWNPALLYWPKCVAGCEDVTQKVENGKTASAPSTIAGKPPFTTGNVVEFTCNAGYTLNGKESVTCTSQQIWDNPVPTCSPLPGTTISSLGYNCSRKLSAIITFIWIVCSFLT